MTTKFIETDDDAVLFGAAQERITLPDDTTFAIEPEADKRNAAVIRTDLAKVETALSEFDKVSAGLAALYEQYPVDLVYDVTTTAGLTEAARHRAAYRDPRIDIEKMRKVAKAPVTAIGKNIDARAAWITAKLRIGEEPADAQIKAEESRRAQIKADKEAAEFGRVLAIQEALAAIAMDVQIASTQPSARIAAVIDELKTAELDKLVFQEMMAAAVAARDAGIAKLELAFKAKRFDEQQEADRVEVERKRIADQAVADSERLRVAEANRAEALRLAGIAAQQEAQAQVLAAQHAAQLKQIADGMAALAKAQKEADDRKATEARAVQDAQSEAAKLEAARVAALVPAEPVAALAAPVPAEPVAVAPLPFTAPCLPTVRLKDFTKMLGFPLPGLFIVDVLCIDPELILPAALWTDSQAQSIFGALIEHVSAAKSAHGKSLVESQ